MTRRDPDLPARFLEPPGTTWGDFITGDGHRQRWASLASRSPIGHCVLVGGFSECIEKYFETMADLAGRNLAVWCLEWHGQGESARPWRRSNRPRARDYDRDATHLARFAASVAEGSRPLVVVAHSMGAAVALLAMRENRALFDAAILSAPMLAIRTARMPWRLARTVSALAVATGLGNAVVPGTRTWPVDPASGPDRSKTSSDPERCRVQASWFALRPQLRIDGITFAWTGSALDLCRRFEDPRMFAEIGAPVLIGSAGIDHFVDNAAHRRAAASLPNCRHIEFADARHELFMEADGIRERWFAEIDRFLRDAGVRDRPAPVAGQPELPTR